MLPTRILSAVLIVSFTLYLTPSSLYASPIVVYSNGVTVQEVISASSGNGTKHEIAAAEEIMTVRATSNGYMSERVVIDGALELIYDYDYDAYGDRRVTSTTVSYNGTSVSRGANQNYVIDYQTGIKYLHPNLEAQIALMSGALSNLHSDSFYAALDAIEGEIQTNGALGCIGSVILYVISFGGLVGCTTVILCVGAILAHLAAKLIMLDACGMDI